MQEKLKARYETFEHALGAEFGTELWKYVQQVSARRGEVLIEQGQVDNTLYLLQKGRISVYGKREDGTFKRLRAINPGAFFNEESLFIDMPADNTVIANSDCLMLALTQSKFEELEAEDPKVAFEIQRALLHHSTVRQRKLERELNQLTGREAHLALHRPKPQQSGSSAAKKLGAAVTKAANAGNGRQPHPEYDTLVPETNGDGNHAQPAPPRSPRLQSPDYDRLVLSETRDNHATPVTHEVDADAIHRNASMASLMDMVELDPVVTSGRIHDRQRTLIHHSRPGSETPAAGAHPSFLARSKTLLSRLVHLGRESPIEHEHHPGFLPVVLPELGAASLAPPDRTASMTSGRHPISPEYVHISADTISPDADPSPRHRSASGSLASARRPPRFRPQQLGSVQARPALPTVEASPASSVADGEQQQQRSPVRLKLGSVESLVSLDPHPLALDPHDLDVPVFETPPNSAPNSSTPLARHDHAGHDGDAHAPPPFRRMSMLAAHRLDTVQDEDEPEEPEEPAPTKSAEAARQEEQPATLADAAPAVEPPAEPAAQPEQASGAAAEPARAVSSDGLGIDLDTLLPPVRATTSADDGHVREGLRSFRERQDSLTRRHSSTGLRMKRVRTRVVQHARAARLAQSQEDVRDMSSSASGLLFWCTKMSSILLLLAFAFSPAPF